MKSRVFATSVPLALAVMAGEARAALNLPPPVSGLEILDLAGTPIVTSYTNYTANFTATSAASTVTFVFRHDPGFFGFDDVSLTDVTHPGGNLIVNGGFEAGAPTVSGGGAPGWTYFQQAGVTYLGYEAASGTNSLASHGGGFFWDDGSTSGYDGIDQTLATTVGDSYHVSFYLAEVNTNGVVPPGNLYQPTCTNGSSGTSCNGIDLVVYAGNGLPPTGAPEPGALALLGVGLLGVGVLRRATR